MSEAGDSMKVPAPVAAKKPTGTNAIWEAITDKWWSSVQRAVSAANDEMAEEHGKYEWATWCLEDVKSLANQLDDVWADACSDAFVGYFDVEAE